MFKKILIVSNFFYPEITPRAFRTKELAIGFCKRGYQVDVLIPNKEIYKKNPIGNIEGLRILYADEPEKKISNYQTEQREDRNNTASFKNRIIVKLKNIFFYFFPRELYQTYNKGITNVLKKNRNNYASVLSISQPLSIHISVIIGFIFNRNLRKASSIAEFSDPLFRGSFKNVFPLYYMVGFVFSYYFEKFVIPIDQAKSKFNPFKKKNIYVIPQGFDFSDIKLKEYSGNKITTFAYAGNFYKKLRDPIYFMEELVKLDTKFVFRLYLSKNNVYFRELIQAYQNKIKGQIEILDFVPREQLIYELSEVDFLVNFDNENEAMSPSKLIDYAFTQRPILSFNSSTFDIGVFTSFLEGDYSKMLNLDIEKFEIKNVINKYIRILHK